MRGPGGNGPGGNGPGGNRRGGNRPGGHGRDPGNPAGRGSDPAAGPQTRRMPAQSGMIPPTPPAGSRPPIPGGPRPPIPGGPRPATRPGATSASGARRAQTSRGRGKPPAPPGPGSRLGRWGALQGGLGVCLIVASTAIGAIVTMATGRAPGFVLGLFLVIGTAAAALAVRPRAGRTILPVPVLSYLVAALISGFVYNRSADSSRTALAIGAAQWIANGFLPMAMATILAIVLVTVRWYLWHRNQGAGRDSGWPAPIPAATPRRPPGRAYPDYPDSGYPADYQAPGGASGGAGTGSTGSSGAWPDQGRPGPYNFSSGA